MKNTIFFALCAFLLFGASPAEAYLSTDQDVLRVNDSTLLFLVSYRFGHEEHDIILPASASHASAQSEDRVSFNITDEAGTIATGTISSIVLSNASYKDGFYHTGKGIGRTFTLIVAYTPHDQTDRSYHLEVTNLPFNFDGTRPMQLNTSELLQYQTPAASLFHDSNQ